MDYYLIAQIVLSIVLIVTILLQSRGAGLGSAWGGEGQMYGTRRGVEKLLFRTTVLASVLFILISIASLVS